MVSKGWKTALVFCSILALTGWYQAGAAELAKEEQVMMDPQPGPEGPMQGFEPGPEQIERMMAQIRKTNPQKADELVGLREKDPVAFKAELRNLMREQFVKRMAERGGEAGRWQKGGPEGPMPGPGAPAGMGCETPPGGGGPEMMHGWVQQRNEEYMKWLKVNFPDEATKMEQMKGEDAGRAMGISWRKYGRIYMAKDNPQLVAVLKEQMTLKDRRGEILKQIKVTADEKQKKELTGQLEQLVGQQFDLIVKRKQIAYEDLTKKLAELQKEVDQRKAEVEKWKSKDFKNDQVKQRVKELISESEKFEWE